MELFQRRLRATAEDFIGPNSSPKPTAVIGILLGGSNLYDLRCASRESRDWDGAVLVSTKNDIYQLVTAQRQELMAMLKMTQEENPTLAIPHPLSPSWICFDAVRFSGFTALGSKRSVKILSLEYFSEAKTTLDILSYKDKRVYETDGSCRSSTQRYYKIQQATRHANFNILHDQWVFSATTLSSCARKTSFVAFGVATDLILSGIWLYGDDGHGRQIKSKILTHYLTLAGQNADICSFARSARFSRSYRQWLSRELSDLCPSLESSSEQVKCSCHLRQVEFFFGAARTVSDAPCKQIAKKANRVPVEAVRLFEEETRLRWSDLPSSGFSSNSSTYTAELLGPHGDCLKVFGKRSRHYRNEVEGASLAASFYSRVQLPSVTASGDLLYPFFEGLTESQLRQSYVEGGRHDCRAVETLLYTEQRKAEDTLRAYKMSLVMPEKQNSNLAVEPSIHRFFHSRLVQETRMYELYGSTMAFFGQALSTEDFLDIPWNIDGVDFGSLSELFIRAHEVLRPDSTHIRSCPVAFGSGDAHGANIMIAPQVLLDNSPDILYIDYEIAGHHPVVLDLAKPLYNDIFFDTFYMDILPEAVQPVSEFKDGRVCVNLAPEFDELTRAMFEIKKRYLLEPLCHMVKELGGDLDQSVTLLAYALLCCAALTRDYGRKQNAMLQNIAIGIVLSQATGWNELYVCFRNLGLGK